MVRRTLNWVLLTVLALVAAGAWTSSAFALAELTTGGTPYTGDVVAEADVVTFDGMVEVTCDADMDATVDTDGIGQLTELTITNCVSGLFACDTTVTDLPYDVVLDYTGGNTTTGTGTAAILAEPSITADCDLVTCEIDGESGELTVPAEGGDPGTIEFVDTPLTSTCGALTMDAVFEISTPSEANLQEKPALPLAPQGATPGAFGVVAVTTTTTKDVVFKNVSGAAVTVDLFLKIGSGTLTDVPLAGECAGNVATNATCTVRIRFTSPSKAGQAREADLYLRSPGKTTIGHLKMTGST